MEMDSTYSGAGISLMTQSGGAVRLCLFIRGGGIKCNQQSTLKDLDSSNLFVRGFFHS